MNSALKIWVPPSAEPTVERVAAVSVIGSQILSHSHQSLSMDEDFSRRSLTDCWRQKLENDLRSRVAPATLSDYRASVILWGRITGDPPIADIKTNHVVTLRNWFVENAKSAAYFNSTLSAIRVVLRLVSVNWDQTEQPPLVKLPRFERLRESERSVIILSRSELSRLYQAADHNSELTSPAIWPAERRSLCWRTMFVLLTIYGQRIMDIAHRLDWSWIDFQRKRIRFKQSKTGKVPDLCLHWVAYWHLRCWWNLCARPPVGAVFGFPKNRKSRLVDWRKLLTRASLPLSFDFHAFRRTCASLYGASGHGEAADWICGWRPRGVKATRYLEVTDMIRAALKAFPVPKAMRDGAKELRGASAQESPTLETG